MIIFRYIDEHNWYKFFDEVIDNFRVYKRGLDRLIGPLSLLQFKFEDFSIFLSFGIISKIREDDYGIILDGEFDVSEENDMFVIKDKNRDKNIIAKLPKRLFMVIANYWYKISK